MSNRHQRKLEKDMRCPLEQGLEIFGSKWTSRIICALTTKESLRCRELRDEMGNIADEVQAAT